MSQPLQRTITVRYTPATRSVVYDRRESILGASDAHNLIRTLNRTRISTLAPTKPKGGEIYVYRGRIIGKSWRNDGYEGSWRSNGTHYYPRFGSLEYCKQNAVFKVVRHYAPNECADNPLASFRRVAFIELQRQGKENPLIVVHYVGDETISRVGRPHGNTKHGRLVGRSKSRHWRTAVDPDLIESTTDFEVVQPMEIGGAADISTAVVSTSAGTSIVNSSSNPALARAASNTALNEDLREASALGDIDRVAELLSAGADVLSANRVNGWTALHWAAKRGHVRVVGLLLGRGADPEARNTTGQMPADLTGCEKMVRMLGTGTTSRLKVAGVPRRGSALIAEAAAANSEAAQSAAAAAAGEEDATAVSSGGGFVPNYLRNPEFPYASGQSHRRRRLSGGAATRRMEASAAASTSQLLLQERAPHKFAAPVLLQVRVADSADPDFIEVELVHVSFEDLMELVCLELSLDPASVERIRKLPNVRLRNDADVGRLVHGQQLEIVLRDF